MYICTYLKLPTPLVQIYLMNGHYLYQIYLHSSSSGYLSEVSSLKLSKDKKKGVYNSMYWGVSFSLEKHVLFNDIPKGDSNTEKKN